jgi:hypothetical protein
MPGLYHVMLNPLATTALDADPDPADDTDPDTGTAAQILRLVRRRKLRRRLLDWLVSMQIDRSNPVRVSNDNTMLLFETDSTVPAGIPLALSNLFVLRDQSLTQIRAYLTANAANWN